jgi:hypothetical protein
VRLEVEGHQIELELELAWSIPEGLSQPRVL